jgi:segregation and condensation protein A
VVTIETSLSEPQDQRPLVVSQGAFEGPLHLLLELARRRKIDLTRLSMASLAEALDAYLKTETGMDACAEQMVSTTWLVAIKARQLLSVLMDRDDVEQEPPSDDDAARLAFRLLRLAAMQAAGSRLEGLPHAGRDFWFRGAAFRIERPAGPVQTTLWALMKAYGRALSRHAAPPMRPQPQPVFALEDARNHLRVWIAAVDEWTPLEASLAAILQDGRVLSSETTRASSVAASLELARDGVLGLRQDHLFGPVLVRKAEAAA